MQTRPAPTNPSTLDALRRFIGGLTSSEKAYYLKFAKRGNAGANTAHLRLFALLTAGRVITDAQLQKKLGIQSGSQFSALKSHLLLDLLDALAFMRRRENTERAIYTQVSQLEELLNRDASQLAQKLYAKTLALAEKHELHDVVLRILGITGELSYALPWSQQRAALAEAETAQDAALARHMRLAKAKRLFSSLERLRKDAMLRFTPEQVREVEGLERELRELLVVNNGCEILTGAYQAATSAGCRYMLLDFEGARDCGVQAIETFESHPRFAAAHAGVLLSSISTVLYADFALKDIPAAAAHLELGSHIADSLLPQRAQKIFATIHFNTRLKILHKQTDYRGVATLIENEAKDVLRIAQSALPADECMNLQASLCISYFVLGEFDKAENLLFSIKETNHTAQREDVLYFSIVFHLLIFFERRSWYQLHAAADAAYHHLYSRKKLRPFEKELMLFLRKLPAVRSGSRVDYIESFLRRLKSYKTDPVKALYFLYFDYYGWLRSKVMGLDYQEYRRRELARSLPEASV